MDQTLRNTNISRLGGGREGEENNKKQLVTKEENQEGLGCFRNQDQSEWPSSKSIQINAGEGVGKREPSYTVGGNVNWCSHYGKQSGDSFKKLKIELSNDPAIPLLGI